MKVFNQDLERKEPTVSLLRDSFFLGDEKRKKTPQQTDRQTDQTRERE